MNHYCLYEWITKKCVQHCTSVRMHVYHVMKKNQGTFVKYCNNHMNH